MSAFEQISFDSFKCSGSPIQSTSLRDLLEGKSDNSNSRSPQFEASSHGFSPKISIPLPVQKFNVTATTNPMCKCGVPSDLHMVQQECSVKGQRFYGCNQKGQGSCRFFQWYKAESNEGTTQNVCFKCKEPGHWAKDCPSNSSSTNSKQQSNIAGDGGNFTKGNCFAFQKGKCKNGDACPYNHGNGGGNVASKVCFKCKEPGHFSNNCPNR
jgi:hypothetical protein